MKFRLFEFLEESIPESDEDSPERILFENSSSVLNRFEETRPYATYETDFQLIRSCVVIRSLINLERLESFIPLGSKISNDRRNNISEAFCELPYVQHGDTKVFVPLFSAERNRKGLEDMEVSERKRRVLTGQRRFSSYWVDPFREYGLELFSSSFCNLVPLRRERELQAFYSLSFNTVFIISEQGTLEYTIPLFDKGIAVPDRRDIIRRLNNLLVPFFDGDRQGFIDALKHLGFISDTLYARIQQKSLDRD